MKLPAPVLSLLRHGALGGAVVLGVGCSTHTPAIAAEPAAHLAPVAVAPLPPPPPAPLAPGLAAPPPGPAAPPTPDPAAPGTVAVADATPDAGAAHHRHRGARLTDPLVASEPGRLDSLQGVDVTGVGSLGHMTPGAGCGRG